MPSYILTEKAVSWLSSVLVIVSINDWANVRRSLSDDLAPPRLAISVVISTVAVWDYENFINSSKYSSPLKVTWSLAGAISATGATGRAGCVEEGKEPVPPILSPVELLVWF
jgi:hypothetical protein